MNADNSSNAPPSEKTSISGPSNKQDEAAYLADEGARAKAAMTQSLEELKESLQQAADLRLWTRQHPWAAIGVAAVAGFAAATAITPGQGESLSGKASRAADVDGGDSPRSQARSHDEGGRRSAMFASLMTPLFDMAKIAIQSTIASAMGAAMQTSAADVAQQQEVRHGQPATGDFSPEAYAHSTSTAR